MFSLTFAVALITYYNNSTKSRKKQQNKCNNRTIEHRESERVCVSERESEVHVEIVPHMVYFGISNNAKYVV